MTARKRRFLAARVMGASRLRVLWDVMLLESLPQTFVGLRNGVSLGLVIVVVAVMFIGSSRGAGQRVLEGEQLFYPTPMYASSFAARGSREGAQFPCLPNSRRLPELAG